MNTSTSSSRRKQPSSIVRRQVSDELEVSGSSASSSVVSAGGGSGSGSAVAIVPSLNVTSAGESDDGPLRFNSTLFLSYIHFISSKFSFYFTILSLLLYKALLEMKIKI